MGSLTGQVYSLRSTVQCQRHHFGAISPLPFDICSKNPSTTSLIFPESIVRGVSILEATDGVSERADAVVHEGIVIVAPEVEGLRVRAICGTRPIAAPS